MTAPAPAARSNNLCTNATVRCADMNEQEHSATPEPPERPGPGEPPEHPEAPTSPQPAATTPVTAPAAAQPEPRRRGETVKRALTSRGAGWVVATAMTGAVVALAVVLATAPPSIAVQPVGAARSFVVGPPIAGPACLRGPSQVLIPAKLRGQARIQIVTPAG